MTAVLEAVHAIGAGITTFRTDLAAYPAVARGWLFFTSGWLLTTDAAFTIRARIVAIGILRAGLARLDVQHAAGLGSDEHIDAIAGTERNRATSEAVASVGNPTFGDALGHLIGGTVAVFGIVWTHVPTWVGAVAP